MSSKPKRAAFLFGSGISFASNAPNVETLTDNVLNGAWYQHTDSRYFPRLDDDPTSDVATKRVQDFLYVLKNEIAPHIRREGRECNYEDLYAAAQQISQHEFGDLTNPLIVRSLDWIKNGSCFLHLQESDSGSDNRFGSLADRAIDLIQSVVFHGLRKAQEPQGLDILKEVAMHTREMDIFTLNHDCLVEKVFCSASLPVADGFCEKIGDRRIFNGTWALGCGIRLFKLHGSVDWFSFRRTDGSDEYSSVGSNPDHIKDENGQFLSQLSLTPLFLSGTMVKERSYGIGLTRKIFAEFQERLSTYSTLICSGYGWGDKGINLRIREWFTEKSNRRVIVLHEDESTCPIRRAPFFRWTFDAELAAKRIMVVPKWLSACELTDLEPFFQE